MTKSRKREKISEIIFNPTIPSDKGVVCFVSFNYCNLFRISDCAILTKMSGGYRLSYPIKQLKNGKTINVIYPLSAVVGKPIEDFLLMEYEKFLKDKVKD